MSATDAISVRIITQLISLPSVFEITARVLHFLFDIGEQCECCRLALAVPPSDNRIVIVRAGVGDR